MLKVEKDGLPNSLAHVNLIVVHSLNATLFDFCRDFEMMLHLKACLIVYMLDGD
jgi:hypothetical protein